MKKYRLSEELGNIDEEFLEEVLEYKKSERRITVSKKKIAIIVAAAILLVALAIPTAAEAVRHYLHIIGYFGSLNDGNAVTAKDESVKIAAVPLGDGEFKFVIDADTSTAPFDVYTELLITNYSLWDNNFSEYPVLGDAADMVNSSPEWFDMYTARAYSEHKTGPWAGLKLSTEIIDRELHIRFEKESAEEHRYTLVIHAFTGRNADGELIEIQGEWTADFTV